jgi:hypothetical protein
MKSPRPRWLRVALGLLAIVPAPSPAVAGPFDGSPPAEHPGFLVFENTYSARLNAKPEPTDGGRPMTHWQFAYLHHVDERNAWGGGVKLTADTDGYRVGPVVRYRHWLSDSVGLDVGAGSYLAGEDYSFEVGFPSPTVDVGVSFDDWVGFHAGLDGLERGDDGMHFEPYVGIRFGRWLAPVTTVGLGVLIGATVSTMN